MERSEAARLLDVRFDASPRQVRSAFRKKVRAHHPDRNGGRETADFQRLTEARDMLLTPAPVEEKAAPTSAGEPTGPTATVRTGTTPTTGASERASRVRRNHERMEFGYDPNAAMPEPDAITRSRTANRQSNRVGHNGAKGSAYRPSKTVVMTALMACLFLGVVILGVAGVL